MSEQTSSLPPVTSSSSPAILWTPISQGYISKMLPKVTPSTFYLHPCFWVFSPSIVSTINLSPTIKGFFLFSVFLYLSASSHSQMLLCHAVSHRVVSLVFSLFLSSTFAHTIVVLFIYTWGGTYIYPLWITAEKRLKIGCLKMTFI